MRASYCTSPRKSVEHIDLAKESSKTQNDEHTMTPTERRTGYEFGPTVFSFAWLIFIDLDLVLVSFFRSLSWLGS